jgi:hypothetical protein
MKKIVGTAVVLGWATPSLAHHDLTLVSQMAVNGHSHAGSGALIWIAAAVVVLAGVMMITRKT